MEKSSTYDYIQGVHTQKVGKDEKTLYKIRTIDGDEYATFNAALAEKARSYEGHEAKIHYTVVEKPAANGTVYKNVYLDDILDVERPESKPVPAAPSEDSKDVQIARAVALKAAVEYLSIPEQEREPLENLLSLMDLLTERLLGR